MKILLIQPPVRDFYQTSIRTQPIGLAYLASSLENFGHKVEILDCQTHQKRPIPIPQELSYLKEIYPFNDRSPFKLYTGFYHFGMGWEEVQNKIVDSRADVFGISSNFTPYHEEAMGVARIIKKWDPKKIVVMGGSYASCDPEEVLRAPFVDYVVLGEGEYRFPLLIERMEMKNSEEISEIDGIGFRIKGRIHIRPLKTFIEELDSLPYPARDLLDLDRYRIHKKRSTMIITSRGCPHGCVYCSAHHVMGSSFRMRSPENTLQEIMECYKNWGIEVFDIEDDNFTFDKIRAKKLMSLIIQSFGERKIELSAMNGISFTYLDEELLRLMKRAGFNTLNLSFMSVDPETRKRMKRPSPTVEFDKILENIEQVGLNVIAYAIFGMPGQSIEEMSDTLIYLMGKRVLVGPSIYYPTPGTLLFERCLNDGILPRNPSQWRSSAIPIETKEFNRLDIITIFRLARLVNFIKRKMEERHLSEGMTLKEIYQFLRGKHKVDFKDKEENSLTTWVNLFLLLFEERYFPGLRKGSDGKISVFKEPTSQRVLDYFLEKASRRPILGSHSHY